MNPVYHNCGRIDKSTVLLPKAIDVVWIKFFRVILLGLGKSHFMAFFLLEILASSSKFNSHNLKTKKKRNTLSTGKQYLDFSERMSKVID